ncbi:MULTISPECIES: linear amide C-N hydrolase [unclassified Pseudoclavibacter]|uniref:linear amide C-N hydrolase n=1 Tax=unclassified Pseudoclavibacter TaxID=2615177 RepID=UPI000CE8D548|nr:MULTISPECIES: linear amide C-N hydrolase [unclassified Pseudoclavibacter]PPF74018.1 choloylglycine hydrolase [Pseudoclavibacter sp. Z016]PPG01588.1 choloylglycine hydrolase [Pseudoclavibacter sp. RFBI5]
MCTRIVWPDANGSVIVGRNMDFHMDLLTNLWKYPRGIERADGVEGNLTWTAKYGSIVATAFDLIATDGMNEEGFAGHILWLAESEYGKPNDKTTQLSQSVWLQYYLDNFATVKEAVAWTKKSQVQISQLFDPTGHLVPTLHLAINDATGDSAIIEYTSGKPTVYHSRDYKVMTNSPTYDKQLELAKKIEGLGGDQPLPGSTLASDRFARASFYVEHQVQPKTQLDAIAAMFSMIRNAAQPFRTPEPGKPDASQTIWQVVLDLTNKRYVFESTTRPNIVWVDFDEVSFAEGSKVLKLDLVGQLALEGGLAGNVSHKFTDVGPEATEVLADGVKALEFVANKKDDFLAVKTLVQDLVGKKG